MIALLQGEIAYKSFDHLILDVGGVGYRLTIPLSTYYALPESGRVRLHVHTHVREDAIHLFGFGSVAEKEIFTQLIAVSGVGPKLATNILSHIPATDLATALANSDVKRLSSLPGIGKKTAERLVLELKDKVTATGTNASSDQHAPTADRLDDLLSALVNLGYKESAARKALDSLELTAETRFEEILKGALRLLGQ
jgi:Holliday junction DNA helicase RuvA